MDRPEGRRPRRPPAHGRRWTSFVAPDGVPGRPARHLHERTNPAHRLRVEHDAYTVLVHLSGDDGEGWTTVAVDRETRAWAVAQGARQTDTAQQAYEELYRDQDAQEREPRSSA